MVCNSNASSCYAGVGHKFGPDDSDVAFAQLRREQLEFHLACRRGAVEVAKRGCKKVDLNWVDSVGMTALMWASHLGNVDVVRALLDSKADPMVKDSYHSGSRRRTALDYAKGCGLAIDYANDGESEEARSKGRQGCARSLQEATLLHTLMASMGGCKTDPDSMVEDSFHSGSRRRTAPDCAKGCGLGIDYGKDGENIDAGSEGRQECARSLQEATLLHTLMASMGDSKADPMVKDWDHSGSRRRAPLDCTKGCGPAVKSAKDGENEEAWSESRRECTRSLQEATLLHTLMASMGA